MQIYTTILSTETAAILSEASKKLKWSPCDYASPDGRCIDVSIRNCNSAAFDWTTLVDITKIYPFTPITYEQPEVLHYGLQGHFSTHLDRHRGLGHLGTLLVIIPSVDLVGGVLTIHDKNGEIIMKGSLDPGYIVYLPLGIEHSVTAITNGSRLVFKVAVFAAIRPLKSIIEYNTEIDPLTRIVISTGRRMPTKVELAAITKSEVDKLSTLTGLQKHFHKRKIGYNAQNEICKAKNESKRLD